MGASETSGGFFFLVALWYFFLILNGYTQGAY